MTAKSVELTLRDQGQHTQSCGRRPRPSVWRGLDRCTLHMVKWDYAHPQQHTVWPRILVKTADHVDRRYQKSSVAWLQYLPYWLVTFPHFSGVHVTSLRVKLSEWLRHSFSWHITLTCLPLATPAPVNYTYPGEGRLAPFPRLIHPSIHLRTLLSHSELEVVCPLDPIFHHPLKFVNRLTTRIAQQLLDVRHAVGLSSKHPSSSTLPQD